MDTLSVVIGKCTARIIYQPFSGEIDPDFCPLFKSARVKTLAVPSDKNADPYAYAKICIAEIGTNDTYILIPGSTFDIKGTRHGKGGGWYDRFLSAVPKKWPRIGILTEQQLSEVALLRQSWDEPMDFLAIKSEKIWKYVKVAERF